VAVYGERNVPAGYVWSAEHEIRRVQTLMYEQLAELLERV
jgi:hypothetical protein